jgi:hypothetical protein
VLLLMLLLLLLLQLLMILLAVMEVLLQLLTEQQAAGLLGAVSSALGAGNLLNLVPRTPAAGDDSERGPTDRRQGEGQRSQRCTAGKRRDHGAGTRVVVCIVVWPAPRNADVARDARQLQSPLSLTARW